MHFSLQFVCLSVYEQNSSQIDAPNLIWSSIATWLLNTLAQTLLRLVTLSQSQGHHDSIKVNVPLLLRSQIMVKENDN